MPPCLVPTAETAITRVQSFHLPIWAGTLPCISLLPRANISTFYTIHTYIFFKILASHRTFSMQFPQKPCRETETKPVFSKDSRCGFQVHRISDACEKVHKRFHTWLRPIAMHGGLERGAVRARAKRGSRVIRSSSSGRNLQRALGKDNEKGEGGSAPLHQSNLRKIWCPSRAPPPTPKNIKKWDFNLPPPPEYTLWACKSESGASFRDARETRWAGRVQQRRKIRDFHATK